MTRAAVIINPLSGHGRLEHQLNAHTALAHQVLASCGIEATVRPTTRAGDAVAFAMDAVTDGIDLVLAWGGDGTVNEVASALVHTNVPLAIIPAGSGNGLASDLGIPFDPRAALVVAARGRTRAIDAGRMEDDWFFNIAGIGIDAVIAARFAQRALRKRGALAYVQLSTSELLRYRSQRYAVTCDGVRVEHDAVLLAVANGRQYGNGVCIAPGACPDDGLLEVVVVEQLSLLGVAWRLPALFRGTLRPGRGISMRPASTIDVEAHGQIPFHVDGEPRMGHERVSIRTHPGALRVRVPRL